MLKDVWNRLDQRRRVGLAVGASVIAAALIAAAAWLARPEYDVLFANLSAPDAAAMTSELDRMKIGYRLGGEGTSILVDRGAVHATRLKLMGKDLPLHGAVGFELFNNTDFGMTEFAQKINYQRALQGELTRTILSLAEVESARVHLALPEESLFKRDQAKAKAAITLSLHRGATLRPDQVSGIQRLVAAAVNGISPHDVTIVDRQGVALTRAEGSESASGAAAPLDLKAEIEQALARKATAVLDRTFGAGRALASVDVSLDMSQVRVTTEDVRGQGGKDGDTPTGVIVRERETVREESAAAPVRDSGNTGSSFRETDYQVGRRVEQIVRQPGAIQRLHVVAVVQDHLDADQLAQAKALVGAAVGAAPERGDAIVVQSIAAYAARASVGATLAGDGDDSPSAAMPRAAPVRSGAAPAGEVGWAIVGVGGLAAVTALAGAHAVGGRRRREGRQLSESERNAALTHLREWLGSDRPSDASALGSRP